MYVMFINIPEHIANLSAWCGERFEDENFDEGGRQWPHVNYNQSIRLVETSPGVHTLIIEGERCALWGDQHGPLMKALKDEGFEPLVYETTDPTLEWWDTKAGQFERIARRATDERKAQAQLSHKELQEWRTARAYLAARGIPVAG